MTLLTKILETFSQENQSPNAAISDCNYADNYYGDQLCGCEQVNKSQEGES